MKRHEASPWRGTRVPGLGASGLACVLATLVFSPALVQARDGVSNLGGGLDQLATPTGIAQAAASVQRRAATATEDIIHPIQFDSSGRALVRITLNGRAPGASVLKSIGATPSVDVVASDLNYQAGVVEAWVPASSLLSIARQTGVQAVVPVARAITNVGSTTSQGIVQHRVDKLPEGIDGHGITVGVISDSYDTNASPDSAATDVSTGDLPGPGNPINTQPVVVLEDDPDRTDEGRAMLQIVHDMAPKARLGFATANGGQVNLANNIRALAGFPDAAHVVPGFKADVIVDDVIYPDEPMFQDGIVAHAVDEVVAKGVAYFSSAGNNPSTESYDSKLRVVPGAPASWANTNLNFANVPAQLYAGGFHDFDPGSGVDIAQTAVFPAGNTFVFEWNEPFATRPPVPTGPVIASGTGTVPPGGDDSFTFDATAGQTLEIFVDADTSTTGVPIPDTVFTVIGPDGQEIAFQDTGTNPESLVLDIQQTGTYTVIVDAFEEDQFGDFLYRVQPVAPVEGVVTDFNVLFFRSNGAFLGALAEQNLATKRPVEIAGLPAGTFQIVIARANTPTSKNAADRIRWVGFDGIAPQEYFSYIDPVTYGHASARGAVSVGAYAFYAPFIPEAFTSPGPATIYFDQQDKKLKREEVRLKPDLSAMDGANTTFFVQDSTVDPDTFPNFFGTSAAAPHAAAIAALMLDAAGGPGSLKPEKIRKVLQETAFRHDLDPFFSWGVALSGSGNLVTINAQADQNPTSQFDPNVFTLTQIGLGKLHTFSINGSNGDVTQTPNGIVFDERTTPAPQPGQPFVVGRTVGLAATDVTATFSQPADPPGLPGQWKELDLLFKSGSFRSGDLISFGVDRDEANAAGPVNPAAGGNSADLLGDGVLIPSGQVVSGGARFFGTFEGGKSFSGKFNNLIGKGWSPLDGYGFVNAEAAVNAVKRH